MNRYPNPAKIKNLESDIIMLEDQIEEVPEQTLDDYRFKSIPSKKVFLQMEQLSEEQRSQVQLINQRPVQQIKITYAGSQSTDKLKVNNYFGSKKTLQRKTQLPIPPQLLNPENRSRRQFDEEDPNQKLSKLVQKQIQQRQKWENQKQQENLYTNTNSEHISSDVLVINDKESFNRLASQTKLKKISSQKFAAMNLQKNELFQARGDESPQYIRQSQIPKIDDFPPLIIERKKRQLNEIKPLKKKQSTYEVLNQYEFLARDQQGQIAQIKQQANSRPMSSRTLNLKKQRIIAVDIKDFIAFNNQTLPKNRFIEGTLKRDRSGVDNTFFPEYRIVFDQISVIYAKKTMSGYDIGTDPTSPQLGGYNKLGSVKGNLVGSIYNVYRGNNQNQIVATIYYGQQTSQIRNLEIYLLGEQTNYLQLDTKNLNDKSINLRQLYFEGQNASLKKIRKYVNKQPTFIPATGMYKLDFGGKVTIPSVKNVIIVDAEDKKSPLLTFGKFGHDNFYLKAESPLSPLTMIGYLMSSFNFKFATQ